MVCPGPLASCVLRHNARLGYALAARASRQEKGQRAQLHGRALRPGPPARGRSSPAVSPGSTWMASRRAAKPGELTFGVGARMAQPEGAAVRKRQLAAQMGQHLGAADAGPAGRGGGRRCGGGRRGPLPARPRPASGRCGGRGAAPASPAWGPERTGGPAQSGALMACSCHQLNGLPRGVLHFEGPHDALPVMRMDAGRVGRVKAAQFGVQTLRPFFGKALRPAGADLRRDGRDVRDAAQQGLEIQPRAAYQQGRACPSRAGGARRPPPSRPSVRR